MQLVLDNQIWRRKSIDWQRSTGRSVTRAVETLRVNSIHIAEKGTHLAGPRHCGELIDGGNQKARQSTVDWLIHRQNWQRVASRELATAVSTIHSE
ncbi:MAG: hypothetical protein ACKOAH_31930, partial [Pirellula sp.]